jgi:hypothetical protein
MVRGDAIVEVKHRGADPEWLRRVLVRVGAEPVLFSKFALATAAVHGDAGS